MTEHYVSDALDAIYASVTEPDALDNFLVALLERFGGIAGDIVTEEVAALEIATLASHGYDPVFRDSYDESYLGHNPWLDALRLLGDGRLFPVEAAEPALLDTAYHREWALPQGLARSVGALLETDGPRHTWFGLAGRDWSEARLVEICESGFRVGLHGRIGMKDAGDDDRLRRAVSAAMQAHDAATCPDSLRCILVGTDQITVQAMPIHAGSRMGGARVLVAFSDPVQTETAMLEGAVSGLGLTPTETALAAALLGGETLDAFAERHGMKVATARWHLKNIGTKAETHRAEHLVARLARLALPLQRPPHMGGDD